MRFKKTFLFFCLILNCVPVCSFDLALAEIYQYSPEGISFPANDVSRDLFKVLRETDQEGYIKLKLTDSGTIPKSVMEAASSCSEEGLPYLLYGFLKVSAHYYDFEMKLFDRETARVEQVFYAKTSINEYSELVQTMGKRVVQYLYDRWGVTARIAEKQTEKGVLRLETGGGYRLSFGPWSESLMGIFSFHGAADLWPKIPMFTLGIYQLSLGYGAAVDYFLGINREGYESFFLHSLSVGTPFTLAAQWHGENRICVSLMPSCVFDVLIQDRLYRGTATERSSAFGIAGGIGYDYHFFNQQYSLGAGLRYHVVFYNTPARYLEVLVSFQYRLKGKKEK